VKRAFVAGATALGAALFAYSLHAVGVVRLRHTVAQIGWGFATILLLSGLREAARTVAWMRTLDGPVRLRFLEAFRARLAGEALSTLLPMGFVVGEPAKAEHVAHRLPFREAFGALMLELAFYTASLVALFGAGVFSFLPGVAAAALIAAGLVAFLTLRKLQRFVQPVYAFASRHPRRVAGIAALELSYHALDLVEVYVTLTLISPHSASWIAALGLGTVSRAVSMIFKVLPMRVGIDEAGAAMVAHRLALGTTTGLTLALVRKMRLLFWSAIGLTLMFAHSARASRAATLPLSLVAHP
jgi:hypothetical protein